MIVKQSAEIPFRSSAGVLLAHVVITPVRDAMSLATAPLIEIDSADAQEHGETEIQLKESEGYEYEVKASAREDFRVRCSLAQRRRTVKSGEPDAGRLDTSCWCGTLLLELVEGTAVHGPPIATALLDVRSVKLDYRTEYRGMLRRIAQELADLVADARSSAKVSFRSSFEGAQPGRRRSGWC